MEKVRFLDLSVSNPEERKELLDAIDGVLKHGRLVLGPEVEEFERRVAAYCGRKHCIGVGSGTDALILGLKALDIGPGDEVITTPLSWLATGSAILLNGATAVFCDIDNSLNMDPATIESLITPKTKAILPVHFTGRLCRMTEIMDIAKRHGLLVIEDCAQAFGALYQDRPAGSFGDMACFSLNAMKILAALGDAGLVVTDDPKAAERLDALRHSGVVNREYSVELSHNCRLDTVQAAALLKRLDRFEELVERRRAIAGKYRRELAGVVQTVPEAPGYRDVYYTFPVRTPRRDALQAWLLENGIETRIQHPLVMNDQPSFQGRSRGISPKASQIVHELICLPASEKLSDEQQDYVIGKVREFHGQARQER